MKPIASESAHVVLRVICMTLCCRSDKMSGLDLNKKPPKPEKKRIVSSVLLSSVKRLGMCVCTLVYV